VPRKPSTWTIYFPRFHCPWCRRQVRARFGGPGAFFRFDKVGESRGGRAYQKRETPRETVDRDPIV
jgi:hypothetical protein